MQSANPTCSSDLRQSTFATNAASCVAAVIVATIATVINIGGPVSSVKSDFLISFDRSKNRYKALIVFVLVRKNLDIDPKKFIPLILQLGSMYYFFPFSSSYYTRKVHNIKLSQMSAFIKATSFKILPLDLKKQIWLFCKPVVFNKDMPYEKELDLLELSSCTCIVEEGRRRLIVETGRSTVFITNLICIFNFLDFLVQDFIKRVVPPELFSPVFLYNYVVHVPMVVKYGVLNLKPLDVFSITNTMLSLELIDDYEPYQTGRNNPLTIFYLFNLFLSYVLPLDSTYSAFVQSRKARLDRLRYCSSDKQKKELLFLLDQSGSSLRNLIGPRIGSRLPILFLIKCLSDVWARYKELN